MLTKMIFSFLQPIGASCSSEWVWNKLQLEQAINQDNLDQGFKLNVNPGCLAAPGPFYVRVLYLDVEKKFVLFYYDSFTNVASIKKGTHREPCGIQLLLIDGLQGLIAEWLGRIKDDQVGPLTSDPIARTCKRQDWIGLDSMGWVLRRECRARQALQNYYLSLDKDRKVIQHFSFRSCLLVSLEKETESWNAHCLELGPFVHYSKQSGLSQTVFMLTTPAMPHCSGS